MVASGGIGMHIANALMSHDRPREAGAPHEFEQALAAQKAEPANFQKVQNSNQNGMDRLRVLTERRDGKGLRKEIFGILMNTARQSPTSRAVDAQVEFLREHGPDEDVFLDALDDAEEYFNYGQVEEAAENIEETYDEKGAYSAARLLAWYTNESRCDPLTATRILEAAKDTVSKIIDELGTGALRLNLDGAPNSLYVTSDFGAEDAVF